MSRAPVFPDMLGHADGPAATDPAKGWAAGVVDRWRSAESLHGRHRLREQLDELGWPNR